jgi:hypothetical protein
VRAKIIIFLKNGIILKENDKKPLRSRGKGSAKVCQIPGTGKRKKVKIADFLNEDVNHGHIKLKGVGIPLAQI